MLKTRRGPFCAVLRRVAGRSGAQCAPASPWLLSRVPGTPPRSKKLTYPIFCWVPGGGGKTWGIHWRVCSERSVGPPFFELKMLTCDFSNFSISRLCPCGSRRAPGGENAAVLCSGPPIPLPSHTVSVFLKKLENASCRFVGELSV